MNWSSGELDATRVSRHLLTVLSQVLKINLADLVRTGTPGVVAATSGAVFRREAGQDDDVEEQIAEGAHDHRRIVPWTAKTSGANDCVLSCTEHWSGRPRRLRQRAAA